MYRKLIKPLPGLLVVLSLTTACVGSVNTVGEQPTTDVDNADDDDAPGAEDPTSEAEESEAEESAEPDQKAEEDKTDENSAALNEEAESIQNKPTDIPVEYVPTTKEDEKPLAQDPVSETSSDEEKSEKNEQKVDDLTPDESPSEKEDSESDTSPATPRVAVDTLSTDKYLGNNKETPPKMGSTLLRNIRGKEEHNLKKTKVNAHKSNKNYNKPGGLMGALQDTMEERRKTLEPMHKDSDVTNMTLDSWES